MQLFTVVSIRQKYQRLYNLGLLQGKAYRQLEIHMAKLMHTHGLTLQSWKLLGQLYDLSPRRLTDIAQILSVKAPLVTVLADQLFKLNFASYVTDSQDRRSKMMSITEAGKAKILETEEDVKKLMLKLFANTTLSDKVSYIKILEQVLINGEELIKAESK